MDEFRILLESNTDILNHFIDLRIDQPVKDKLKYMDVVKEASLSSAGKSKLIQQLYTDIIHKSNIDFGKIPDSRGNVTAYDGYEVIIKSLDSLKQLFGDRKVEEFELAQKLHNILIANRSDFEFGFKFDITIIQLSYNLLVMGLVDMVNICIVTYVDYLKDVQNTEFKFRGNRKQDLLIIQYVKEFIRSYDKGEFASLMSQFKRDGSGLLGLVTGGILTTGPIIILSVISFLFIVRGLIYVYYATATKFNESLKAPTEFLRTSIEMSGNNGSIAIEKQKKFLDKMEAVSNFIETKILKTNKDAKEDLKKSNRENYDSDSLKNAQFELL